MSKKFYVFDCDGKEISCSDPIYIVQNDKGWFLANPRTGRLSPTLSEAMICKNKQTLEKSIKTDPVYCGMKIVQIKIHHFRELVSDPHKEYSTLPLLDSFVP